MGAHDFVGAQAEIYKACTAWGPCERSETTKGPIARQYNYPIGAYLIPYLLKDALSFIIIIEYHMLNM